MRFRRIMLAAAVAAAMGLVPVASHAAPAGAVYKLTGKLSVDDKANTWSMSGSLSILRSAQVTPEGGLPKSATFAASGKLGAVSIPTDPCTLTATTGTLKISWSGAQPSKATVVHTMTHPNHTLSGLIRSGYSRYGVVIIFFRHKPNNVVGGHVIIVGPDD